MKITNEQVVKVIDVYLNTEHVHRFPVLEITKETVSTYDGDYPLFLINYDSSIENDDEIWDDLVGGIKKYTNLKVSDDYWLGLKWSWSL